MEQNDSQKFREIPISTQTVMAYVNCEFHLETIFAKLQFKNSPTPVHGDLFVPIKKNQAKKAFRNQKSLKILVFDKFITIKVFRTGSLHLTGCKKREYQIEAIKLLLQSIANIHTTESPTFTITEDHQGFFVTLDVVMINIDFNIDFKIDLLELDKLIQTQHNDKFFTVFDPMINTNVNITFMYDDPVEKEYETIHIPFGKVGEKIEWDQLTTNITKLSSRSKSKTVRKQHFMVFSSGKVIHSGRFHSTEMLKAFIKFNTFIYEHRAMIELKPNGMKKKFDLTLLKGIY